jgi:hypothetical protein
VVTGVMTGGVCLSVREREGERGWAGSGQAGPAGSRGRPSWLLGLLFYFYFFLLLPFSFISEFLFCVFERVLLFKFE